VLKFKLLLFVFFIANSSVAFAYADYVVIQKKRNPISNDADKKIQDKGYQIWGANDPINGFVRVKKDNEMSIADAQGNILNETFEFSTSVTKKGIFFTGRNKYGRNDYGERTVTSISHLKSFDTSGDEVITDVSRRNDLEFARSMAHISEFSSSKDDDYITIHKKSDDGYRLLVGLIDSSGRIIIEPLYREISQVVGNYYLLTKENHKKQIINLKTLEVHSVIFDELQTYSQRIRLKVNSQFVNFDGKILAKANGKYGLYSLESKQWIIPNQFDSLMPITGTEKLKTKIYDGDPLVLYTNRFIAQKESRWGVISHHDKVIVPFNYDFVTSENPNSPYYVVYSDYYSDYHEDNRMNLYSIESKKEVVNGFYRGIYLVENYRDVALITISDKKIAIIDVDTQKHLVAEVDGYTEYSYERGGLFKLKHASGRKAIFSPKLKKIISPKPKLKTAPLNNKSSILSIVIPKKCPHNIERKRKNLALKAHVIAGSTYCSGSGSDCYTTKRVNDGDFSTSLGGYSSWVNRPGKSKELVFNWQGKSIDFQQINVYTTRSYPVSAYDLFVNIDSGWKKLVSVKNNRAESLCHAFETMKITGLKFIGKQGPSSQKAYVRVNEIAIY